RSRRRRRLRRLHALDRRDARTVRGGTRCTGHRSGTGGGLAGGGGRACPAAGGAVAGACLTPDYGRRLDRARRLAAEDGLAGLYVSAGPNFRWLTGEVPHPGGWPLWLSALVVPVDGEAEMVVSKMHAAI